MKEMKIEIPAGCEIEKTEILNGALTVMFKPKEPQLPIDWEDFCEKFPIQVGECFFSELSVIKEASPIWRHPEQDKNLLPDRETAEAVLALCQLIQLRNAYNGDWVPDWNDDTPKYTIEIRNCEFDTLTAYKMSSSFLYFKTSELRDELLRNFRTLIEKLKPLYGIAL